LGVTNDYCTKARRRERNKMEGGRGKKKKKVGSVVANVKKGTNRKKGINSVDVERSEDRI